MLFIRFIANEDKILSLPLSSEQEAEIAAVKEGTPITTGNVYAVSAYDIYTIQTFAVSRGVRIEKIDSEILSQVDNFPQFRNALIPLTEDDLSPTESKAFYKVLVVDGLGICINDMLYRSAAWRALANKMNESEVAFSIDFTASIPFVPLQKLLLANRVSEKVLFGPVLLDTVLRYDFIVNESGLSSLSHSHSMPFTEQVSSIVEDGWKVSELTPISLPELIDDPELFEERINDVVGDAPFVLLNGAGDFSFNQIPREAQISIVRALRAHGVNVATMGDLELDDEGVFDVSGMASSLGVLDIITQKASAVVTTNSPTVALATKNATPLLILSIGAEQGVYTTAEGAQKTLIVAEYDFFNNLNQVNPDELKGLVEKWKSLDITAVVESVKRLADV